MAQKADRDRLYSRELERSVPRDIGRNFRSLSEEGGDGLGLRAGQYAYRQDRPTSPRLKICCKLHIDVAWHPRRSRHGLSDFAIRAGELKRRFCPSASIV